MAEHQSISALSAMTLAWVGVLSIHSAAPGGGDHQLHEFLVDRALLGVDQGELVFVGRRGVLQRCFLELEFHQDTGEFFRFCLRDDHQKSVRGIWGWQRRGNVIGIRTDESDEEHGDEKRGFHVREGWK